VDFRLKKKVRVMAGKDVENEMETKVLLKYNAL
jgi:hypothetical protein